MEFTAKQIAEYLQGTIEGDENAKINTIAKIEEGKKGALSFLANTKYTNYIYSTDSSIVLVNKDFKAEKKISTTLIRVENAYQSFASLLELYNEYKNNKQGIDAKANISESAKIGKNVYIGAFVNISDNVKIGDNVKIYPNTNIENNVKIGDSSIIRSGVNIYEDSIIGKSVILHSGVVIGADGFGFAPKSSKDYMKVPQIGNVIIENDVEVGANSTIDRATIGSTIIRKGVKLDNHVQIAHNVEIGENTVIAALSGVSGSCKIGKNCMVGGQVGFNGHIKVGDNVKIGAQTGIMSNTKDNAILLGTIAFNARDYMRSYSIFKKLPEMEKRLREVEKNS